VVGKIYDKTTTVMIFMIEKNPKKTSVKKTSQYFLIHTYKFLTEKRENLLPHYTCQKYMSEK